MVVHDIEHAVDMTAEAHNEPRNWAVIIGIDFYPEHEDERLKGAVRDAQTVKRFLEAQFPSTQMIILTAETPIETNTGHPSQTPEAWPTYESVVSSLRRIIHEAKRGDFIYVHFSGHGTQLPSLTQSSHDDPLELALVLLSEDGRGSRYLRGQILARAMHKMVEMGLFVTLVLDCCFSGNVVRANDWRGIDVRCIDYNPDVDLISLHEQDADLFEPIDVSRDSSLEKAWLLNPNGYGILSACAPHERAYEIETGDGRRGALTYFLLETLATLAKRSTKLTFRSIHDLLSIRFHISWPRQNPMRYGNENFVFLRYPLGAPDRAFVPIYKNDSDTLILRAGHIHGVCKDDRYAVYPFDAPEQTPSIDEDSLLDVRVSSVRAFESELVEDCADSLTSSSIGWKAKPLTSFSPEKIPIKLLESNDHSVQLQEIAKDLHFAILLTESQAQKPCSFNVSINVRGEYEVLDSLHKRVSGVPKIPCNRDGSTEALTNILQHLTTYKFFEGIDNRLTTTTFEISFLLTPKISASASGAFEVKHNTKWELIVENGGDTPLYLAIFDFAPSWRVKNLISRSGGGGYKIIPPKTDKGNGTQVVGLRMKVPEFMQNHGRGHCEDIIKLFITSKPTSFPLMVLPALSQSTDNVYRLVDSSDDFLDFLSRLDLDFRVQGEDRWIAKNFIIRTVLE